VVYAEEDGEAGDGDADGDEGEEEAVDLGLTEYEKTELGDMSPDYRYLL